MQIEINANNAYDTNCYLVTNEETLEALIIDPAGDIGDIRSFFKKNGLKLAAVFLTHGHYDHISLADAVKKAFNVHVYAGLGEKKTLFDPRLNLSSGLRAAVSVTPDIFLEDAQTLTLAGFNIKVISTPGHTPGGVCFYFENEKACFTGDTLFKSDFGRCDLPGGSLAQLRVSITKKLFALPDETAVYPGHGETTTVSDEKKRNAVLLYKQ